MNRIQQRATALNYAILTTPAAEEPRRIVLIWRALNHRAIPALFPDRRA